MTHDIDCEYLLVGERTENTLLLSEATDSPNLQYRALGSHLHVLIINMPYNACI